MNSLWGHLSKWPKHHVKWSRPPRCRRVAINNNPPDYRVGVRLSLSPLRHHWTGSLSSSSIIPLFQESSVLGNWFVVVVRFSLLWLQKHPKKGKGSLYFTTPNVIYDYCPCLPFFLNLGNSAVVSLCVE